MFYVIASWLALFAAICGMGYLGWWLMARFCGLPGPLNRDPFELFWSGLCLVLVAVLGLHFWLPLGGTVLAVLGGVGLLSFAFYLRQLVVPGGASGWGLRFGSRKGRKARKARKGAEGGHPGALYARVVQIRLPWGGHCVILPFCPGCGRIFAPSERAAGW